MNNFFKLIYNELTKTYIRKSTWIMYIILACLVIGFGVITKSFDDYDATNYEQDNWREVLQEENETLLQEEEAYQNKMEASENEDEFFFGPDLSKVEENNLYLEKDIQPSNFGAWQFVAQNAGLLSVVSLLTIIIAAGIIAHEFRWGTIKLLLIRPISRTKILVAKYISVLLFALFSLIFVFVLAWITGAVLFGIEGANPNMLVYYFDQTDNYTFKIASVFSEIVSGYGYSLVNLLMMSTFAFMISAVFRNSSLAIGAAIFLMMGGSMIVGIFQDKPFAKYILFANTDLKQYHNGQVLIEGMTLGFSISVLIVYYVIFLALSWFVFTKRDVSGQ